MSDKIRIWFDSEEGKKSIERSQEEHRKRKEHESRWIEKFKRWAEPDMDSALEKLMTWYDSDKYVKREYSLGYEPREKLLWLAFEYAVKYCDPCDDETYFNPFTGNAYYIGSYVIQIMYGQGSAIRLDKVKGKVRKSKKESVIKMIEERILSEHRKHSRSLPDDWARIAAGKIYSTLTEKGI
jgi:hypothetical protein